MAAMTATAAANIITSSIPEPLASHQREDLITQKQLALPPSPPATEKEPGSRTESVTDFQIGESALITTVDGHHQHQHQHQQHPYPLPPESRPSQRVLPEDLKTPDKHVPRDPRLLRLTGVHPFNVEPPLTDLWDEGFITTKDLHYVRNHGAVPQVHDDDVPDWTFSVEGLVEQPLTLTLRDLLAEFEQVTYPVTLVCAGNRRKEQNLVRKTKGFSWGAAGVSTALWTGVPLAVLLARARPIVRGSRRRARYVCFEGADKLPNGCYGTSIKLSWAADPERGVMIAHGMNGEMLSPDHGKPLRVVIPGQIGGRSVKWLTRIIVTEEPSDNWYHIYDNRVLPTTISPEESAGLPEVWKDERYAIYDLNTNSAVARPAHEERVAIHVGDKDKKQQTFRFEGYAYAGGGRRVTRVELTLDRGRTWRLADVRYPEDEYRAAPEGETLFGGRLDVASRDTCFCWCFWSLDLPLADLADTGDVMVRAMDDSMNVQPRDLYWSVLGMMNNPWFRVVVHRDLETGELWFEHPTVPILNRDGWMDRVKKGGGDLANGYWGERTPGEGENINVVKPAGDIVMVNRDVRREISLEELREHEGEEEPWFVLGGEVYDGTSFLGQHPGGAASIIGAAGQDVIEEFMAIRKSSLEMPLFSLLFHLVPSPSSISESLNHTNRS
jgi:nitrate reductase (NAD(P)H)